MKTSRLVMHQSVGVDLPGIETKQRAAAALPGRMVRPLGKMNFSFFTGGSRRRRQLVPISQAPKFNRLSREEQVYKMSRRFMRSIVLKVAKKHQQSLEQMQPALMALYEFFSSYPLHRCDESVPMNERYALATDLLRQELIEQGVRYSRELELHLPEAQMRRLIAGLPQPTRLVVAFDWDNTLFFRMPLFGFSEQLMSSLLRAVELYLCRLQRDYLKRGVTFIIVTARTPCLSRAGIESAWVRSNVPVIFTGNMVPKIKFCQDISMARQCSVILMDDNPMELHFFQQAKSSLEVDVKARSGMPVELNAIDSGMIEADLKEFMESLELRDVSAQDLSRIGEGFVENLFKERPFKLLALEIERCVKRHALREVAEQKKPSPSP